MMIHGCQFRILNLGRVILRHLTTTLLVGLQASLFLIMDPMMGLLGLMDVISSVKLFLDPMAHATLAQLSSEWQHFRLFSPAPSFAPWPPIRRRLHGFGKVSAARTIRHTTPSPHLIFHHAWSWLQPSDRAALSRAYPAMKEYAVVRQFAASTSVSALRLPRPTSEPPPVLDDHRCLSMGAALLRFDFLYGDFVRWLGGEYTNRHRDWNHAFEQVSAVTHIPPDPGEPVVDYGRAYRICTEGIPLKGHFECATADVDNRVKYDNHPGVYEQAEAILKRLAKEEHKSFHVALPRFMYLFIYGLHVCPMRWAIRHDKGRLCIDPTSRLKSPNGAPNASIPKPKEGRQDECPSVFYATAFIRYLIGLWDLRISHPTADILQHCDDLDAAFHRILYHPDMAILFASVFQDYLIIPVGAIFGAVNSPSFFSCMSELRAHLASFGHLLNQGQPLNEYAQKTPLPDPITPADAQAIIPAVADAKHNGVDPSSQRRFFNQTFVDDNGKCALYHEAPELLHNSAVAGFILFGDPSEDRRPSCINADKWDFVINHIMRYLGFDINSRTMTVTWPIEKRLRLRAIIEDWIANPTRTPRDMAKLLGIIRSAGVLSPLGIYLSIRLQHHLNELVSTSGNGRHRRWWKQKKFRVRQVVLRDLHTLLPTLDEDPHNPVWTRYIGLLVPRAPTSVIKSDASYSGIGGWSKHFQYMWRVDRGDLIAAGFNMFELSKDLEPMDTDVEGTHINILEFIALFLNTWIALWIIRRYGPIIGGHILNVLANNTSALSWMFHASRSRSIPVCQLSQLFSALLLQFQTPPCKVLGSHLPGIRNDEADCLSRPIYNANGEICSWASAINQWPQLEGCRICLIPSDLMQLLASVTSKNLTADQFDEVTIKLSLLEPVILSPGASITASTTSVSTT